MRPPLLRLVPILIAALLAMALAVAWARKAESALAAAAFAVTVVAAGVRTNMPFWRCVRGGRAMQTTTREALIPTVTLIALSYLWCGIAFYAIYLGTNLHWQHGWEYGTAMVVVAFAHAFFLRRLHDPSDVLATEGGVQQAVRLAGLQAIAIALALIWLIKSGKLASIKGDWAANQLFVAGGFAIMCLSMIVLKTYSQLPDQTPDRIDPPISRT